MWCKCSKIDFWIVAQKGSTREAQKKKNSNSIRKHDERKEGRGFSYRLLSEVSAVR